MNNMIPAVDKTVQMLEMLSGGSFTQSELSRALGISMSSTYRILQTLLMRDWVRKVGAGGYVLSAGLLPVCKVFDCDLEIIKKARQKVDEICSRYHIACKLSLRRGNVQLTDYRAEPPGPVRLTGNAGSSFPVVEGSVGAALLADESDEHIAALLENCDVLIPEKADPRLLKCAIDEVREHNCILNLRKNRWNIAAFSVPLRDNTGRIFAALTLIGTADDFAGAKRQKWQDILFAAVAWCENTFEQ